MAQDIDNTYSPSAVSLPWGAKLLEMIPSIGRSRKDFAALASNDSSDISGYLVSASLLALIIVACTMFWMTSLLIFKLVGPRRLCECGFRLGLAGNAFEKPVDLRKTQPLADALALDNGKVAKEKCEPQFDIGIPTQSTDLSESDIQTFDHNRQMTCLKEALRVERRVKRIRITALLFGTILIVSSVLFDYFGLSEVRDAVRTSKSGADKVGSLALQSGGLTTDMLGFATSATETSNLVLKDLKKICPNANANGGSVILSNGATVDVQLLIDNLALSITNLDDFSTRSLGDLQQALTKFNDMAADSEDKMEVHTFLYWTGIVSIVLFDLIAIVFMVGVIQAWRERSPVTFEILLSWMFLPFFSVLIIATAFASSTLGIGAMINADFCSGGGGSTVSTGTEVENILSEIGYDRDGSFYKTSSYFSNGCTSESPTKFADELESGISTLISSSTTFRSNLQNYELPLIDQACGQAQGTFSSTLDTLRTLDVTLPLMNAKLSAVKSSLECSRIQPIYSKSVDDAVCVQGMNGLSWMMITLAVMSLSGLIMITFRAGFYQVIQYADIEEEEDFSNVKNIEMSGCEDNFLDENCSSFDDVSFNEPRDNDVMYDVDIEEGDDRSEGSAVSEGNDLLIDFSSPQNPAFRAKIM
eukprot:CAMPEP_0198283942 /NCGR_PEP_ID=MMETSP1449-20131203/3524_1 /TAXON_ID=420275 /ORGANISM="Attheya septentrionalis, Strain CCMP2084" /LENGTH=644 /DNA_ID=CAMNT_0043980845 /DNA_START=144 /DNA_END=2078 /DNA_ORIENTATION=+